MDRWLRTQVSDLPDANELPDGLPQVTQFTRGASNLTYRLTYGGHDLVLRRPPAGTKAASAHDMGREVHVINHVRDQFPYVPRIDAYCTDDSVIGCTSMSWSTSTAQSCDQNQLMRSPVTKRTTSAASMSTAGLICTPSTWVARG